VIVDNQNHSIELYLCNEQLKIWSHSFYL